MATASKPIKGRAYPHTIALVNSTTPTSLVSAPTVAASNVKLSQNGGATWANITTAPVVNGVAVALVPNATEMTSDSVLVWVSGVTGAADLFYELLTFDPSNPYYSFFIRDGSGLPATGKTVTAYTQIDGAVGWTAYAQTITEVGNGYYRIPQTLALMTSYSNTLNMRFTVAAGGCQDTDVSFDTGY